MGFDGRRGAKISVAIVMARGGSKRIPRKNVKMFAGKPCVAWAVDAAVETRLFRTVVISTDDREIAHIAIEHGAIQLFTRPSDLANDYATTLDVLRHAVGILDCEEELLCCLYGTSVFATPELLSGGKKILDDNADCEAVMCAVQFEHPPQRGFSISQGGRASFVNARDFASRTQDLTPVFHDVGLFYWFRVHALLDKSKKSLADFNVRPLVLPRGLVVDIDTEEDWLEAEKIIAQRRQ